MPIAAFVFFVLATCAPALAVVPGLMGPLQALLQMLPQLFMLILGTLGGLLGFPYWRERLLRHRKVWAGVALTLIALTGWLWYVARPRASIPAQPTPSPTIAVKPWTSFRGDGLGVVDDRPLPPTSQIQWTYSDNDGSVYDSSPAVCGDRLYVGSTCVRTATVDGAIECHDLRGGQLVWRTVTKFGVISSPAVADGRVYCGEGYHEDKTASLYCVDAASGKQLWAFRTGGHIEGAPMLHDGRVLFSAGDDGVYCLDAASGTKIWQARCGHSDSCPAVADGKVFVGTAYGSDAAVCLDLASGRVLWSRKQAVPVWGHAAVAGDRVCFGIGNGTFDKSDAHPRGGVVCYDLSGKELWRHDLPDSVQGAVTVADRDVLLGCRDGYVYCLALQDGKRRWRADCGRPVLASLCVLKDTVYAAGGDGGVHALDRADGSQRFVRANVSSRKIESSPVLANGRLYVGAFWQIVCLGL